MDTPNGDESPSKKSPLHITSRIDWDASNGTLTFDWKDGERTVLNLAELPVEQQTALMYWGCIARLQQGYVSCKGSPVVARAKVAKLWQQLKAGEGLRRADKSVHSITVQAIALLLKIPAFEAQARWNSLDPQKKKEVASRGDVLSKVAAMKAAAQGSKVSLDAILK